MILKRCRHCKQVVTRLFFVRRHPKGKTLVGLCGNCAELSSLLGGFGAVLTRVVGELFEAHQLEHERAILWAHHHAQRGGERKAS